MPTSHNPSWLDQITVTVFAEIGMPLLNEEPLSAKRVQQTLRALPEISHDDTAVDAFKRDGKTASRSGVMMISGWTLLERILEKLAFHCGSATGGTPGDQQF